MFRALLRLVIVVVILVGVGAFFLGYWGSGRIPPLKDPGATVGTAGRIDTEKAKEVGADVAAKTAQAANKAGELLNDGALSAKIKSKMALDDLVKARSIDVSTIKELVRRWYPPALSVPKKKEVHRALEDRRCSVRRREGTRQR